MLPVTPAEIDAMSDEPRRTEPDAAFDAATDAWTDDDSHAEEQRRHAAVVWEQCGGDDE